jgi:hypothetical protein
MGLVVNARNSTALVALLLAAACSSSGKTGDHDGRWLLTSEVCDGRTVVTPGFEYTLDLAGDHGTARQSTAACAATVANFAIDGDALDFETGSVSCSPPSCTISVTASIAGVDQIVSARCPEDFAQKGPSKPTISRVGTQLQEMVTAGKSACTLTFDRL